RRPEHRDLPVLILRELMRGDREVEVGDQPRDPDADREQAGASPVASGLIRRLHAPYPRHDGGLCQTGCPPPLNGLRPAAPTRSPGAPPRLQFWLTDQSISPIQTRDGSLLGVASEHPRTTCPPSAPNRKPLGCGGPSSSPQGAAGGSARTRWWA